MTAMQSKLKINPPPSADGVASAMSNVFERLRNVQSETVERAKAVETQRGLLDEDRQRMTADHEELDGMRGEVEAKLAGLGIETEKVQRDVQAAEEFRAELDHQREKCSLKVEQLDSREELLSARQDEVEESGKELLKKEDAAAQTARDCEAKLRELASQQAETQRQVVSLNDERNGLADRKAQLGERSDRLDVYATELDGSRGALEAMQAQLLRDQSEITTHREALLTQIGRPTEGAAGASDSADERAKTESELQDASRPATVSTASRPVPKAGGGSAAEQFRKLRRDAKRKSIGL